MITNSCGATAQLQLVLGELCLEVAAASVESVGSRTRLLMSGMIATAVAATTHRKRVLPARHVGLQLSGCLLELGAQPLWQIRLHGGGIEPAGEDARVDGIVVGYAY